MSYHNVTQTSFVCEAPNVTLADQTVLQIKKLTDKENKSLSKSKHTKNNLSSESAPVMITRAKISTGKR